MVVRIDNKEIFNILPKYQNKFDELRHTRNADFTDEVAREFLSRKLSADELGVMLSSQHGKPELLSPFYL